MGLVQRVSYSTPSENFAPQTFFTFRSSSKKTEKVSTEYSKSDNFKKRSLLVQIEGVVAYCCLTLKSEQSGGVGSIPGRTPPLERHDKGSRTRLALSHFCDPSASPGAKSRNFTFILI